MLKQKEWIDVIVTKTGCTKKDAKLIFDCAFDYIREQISEEEPIKIQGFGVFKLRKTAAKEQINLITGQPEIVPEHGVVTFKPQFEIDPKPEAIEVEDEEVIEEVVETVIEPVHAEEEVLEEVVEEEVVETVEEPVQAEEEVVEEEAVPVEEPAQVEEEAAPVEEPAQVEEEAAPVEEPAQVEEEVVEEDNVTWVYGKETLTTAQLVEVLKEKTSLSAEEIVSSLNVVKANMERVGKTTCEVRETEETVDFIIVK